MRVIVLGNKGQLGTDLHRAAEQRASAFQMSGLDRDEVDVCDAAAVREVLTGCSFEAMINCTSYHKTDEVESNGTLAFAVNAHAAKTLAEICAERKARFVQISTDYVFAGTARRPYVETDAPGPVNVYGASKLMGETLPMQVHDDVIVTRVASLFGVAGAAGKGGNFVETMIRVGTEKGQLSVVDDVTMSPTATTDVAEMILTLLERNAEPGIYHVVNTGAATWCDFARKIITEAGVNAEVKPITSDEYPTPARRPAYSVLNNSKTATVVGDIPPWPDALTRYLHAKGHVK